jgi:hypothetical protein
MSVQASPPPASISIAWTSTLPRSCTGARSPAQGITDESEWPSPRRSAKLPKACNPTWATAPVPPPSTTTPTVQLLFTLQVPSWTRNLNA